MPRSKACLLQSSIYCPSRDTVRRWQVESGPFRDRYAVARDQQADADSVAVCRLQIDTIKWLIAKIAPRRYGEKVVLDTVVKASIGDAIEKGRERVLRLRAG